MPRLMTILIVLTALSLTALGGCGPLGAMGTDMLIRAGRAVEQPSASPNTPPKKCTTCEEITPQAR